MADTTWYVQDGDSEAIGPVTTELLIDGIRAGRVPVTARICRVGGNEWTPLAVQPSFAGVVREVAPPPPTSKSAGSGGVPAASAPVATGDFPHCPGCGAPARSGTDRCPYCGAPLGHHDPASFLAASDDDLDDDRVDAAAADDDEHEEGDDGTTPEQLNEQLGTPGPANFEGARETWAGEFSRILVFKPFRVRAELEQSIRSVLASFRMAPSNFAKTAHLHLAWCWFPIIIAKARFESEWSGTAVPYTYVDAYDSRGNKRREKRRLAPRSFSGSTPSQVYTAFASGDPGAVPHVLLLPAQALGSVGADVEIERLRGEVMYGLPETGSCPPLRFTQALAATFLSEIAHRSEERQAESELRSLTNGDWEDRRVRVRLRSDHHTYRLGLVPALVGDYTYRGKRWRTIALASNGYAGCEGAPTSLLKVAFIVAAVGAVAIGLLGWLGIGPGRSLFEKSAETSSTTIATSTNTPPAAPNAPPTKTLQKSAAPSKPPARTGTSATATPPPSMPSATATSEAISTSAPSKVGAAVELAPDDVSFVDARGGAGWGDRCWKHLQANHLGWAKAACDRAMEMNPATPQPKASLLYNKGLVETKLGHTDAARQLFVESLALRPNAEVQAALNSLGVASATAVPTATPATTATATTTVAPDFDPY